MSDNEETTDEQFEYNIREYSNNKKGVIRALFNFFASKDDGSNDNGDVTEENNKED